ncbi:MAG TPA: TetR/AcrR family transcriptional regulator [Solirubrobacteraceae bacterium]|nr:TetR/AcrR family transcriptional regulator [Solirubrobacteraceae bacterium]
MAYHHGDLRRAVLDGALAAIEADGPAALSLRDVARRAGVSHAAPAHHFGDKAGVLTAIAAEGYDLLAAATADALTNGERFLDGGLAYIRFALTHRAHFEVMFRPDLHRTDDPALAAARAAAGAVLFDGVRRQLGERAREEDVIGGVVAIWSFCHGFATLWLSGNLDRTRAPEAVAEAAVATAARLADADAFQG